MLGVKSGDVQKINGIWVWAFTDPREPIPWNCERGVHYGYNPDLSALQQNVA
ncbi:hypothetical protein [Halioglobus sp. HI00S01]|uniref:hypothetical protein n=1 Tax=Halioglobus sp. HI00S01 TaxID=1822214 RepID=UPI0012E890DC|nr:hypothetical protein [Halioglobus sp. HI00S01]